MSIIPGAKPRLTRDEAIAILKTQSGYKGGVAVLAVRGYYRDTMGVPGKNDRGIYDDAVFVVTDHAFAAFNANTDPRVYRSATRTQKGIASLKAGVWKYKKGIHGLSKPASQRYPAFVQAAHVTVLRDGSGADTGWFGINIHKGSLGSTSSAGCQTIPPGQWEAFRALVNSELDRVRQTAFNYVLIDGPVR